MSADEMAWTNNPMSRVVSELTPIPLPERRRMREGPFDAKTHRRYFNSVPALREIETGGVRPSRRRAKGPVRVAAWNVERLPHLDAIADTLKGLDPDVILLSEIDSGMARTGNSRR